MNQTYQNQSVPSPLSRNELLMDRATNTQNPEHMAREVIQKYIGNHQLTIKVEEDVATLQAMKSIQGLVAFLATILRGSEILSQGRGCAVLFPNYSRGIDRTVATAFNASISDAVLRSTRVLDTFSGIASNKGQGGQDTPKASDKQVAYLRTLISRNITIPNERRILLAKLDTMSKNEAGELITQLR
jgi:hypothetical protein